MQKTNLVPVEYRLKAIEEGGYNTFALRTKDVFVDMLTGSGANAISYNQLSAMMVSDDAYAGSEGFYKLAGAIEDVLDFKYVLPVYKGKAAEHLIGKVFIKPGDVIPMNYHFTTAKPRIQFVSPTIPRVLGGQL
ncbi:hypothetical protein AMJ80_08525 [bacterium SM23_31]|nr:MAG: hypothetical protein AMJ80_08525 [bacterium SM23_31]